MSDERQNTSTGGAPLEDTTATPTDLNAAVTRANEPELLQTADTNAVPPFEMPSAAAQLPGEGLLTDSTGAPGAPSSGDADLPPTAVIASETSSGNSQADTVLNDAQAESHDSSASTVAAAALPNGDDRDEIRVAPDHPMAPLYVQTPAPPEVRGNRGAGALIALLATVAFAALLAGAIAISLAPKLAPSQFIAGLTDELLNWPFLLATGAFFLGLILLILIVNRAGWWAYVLGGFLVGVLVWGVTGLGVYLSTDPATFGWDELFALAHAPWPLISGLIAREVVVWFGAWIGARGRKMKALNKVALQEYEEQVAAAQAA